MARRRSKRNPAGSFLRLALILLACLATGGAGAWLVGGGNPARLPDSFASAADPATGDRPDAMSRPRLESEVLRLRRLVDARDRQIADLMIQVKLLSAGSPAAGPPE